VTFIHAEARPKFTYRRFSELAYLFGEQIETRTFNELLKAKGLKYGGRTIKRRTRSSSAPKRSGTTRKPHAARVSRSKRGRSNTR